MYIFCNTGKLKLVYLRQTTESFLYSRKIEKQNLVAHVSFRLKEIINIHINIYECMCKKIGKSNMNTLETD